MTIHFIKRKKIFGKTAEVYFEFLEDMGMMKYTVFYDGVKKFSVFVNRDNNTVAHLKMSNGLLIRVEMDLLLKEKEDERKSV